MDKKRSAYDIPPTRVDLDEDQKREAIAWWQEGRFYHPLKCPVCGNILTLAAEGASLCCPTNWCAYMTREIPWAVFVAWERDRLAP